MLTRRTSSRLFPNKDSRKLRIVGVLGIRKDVGARWIRTRGNTRVVAKTILDPQQQKMLYLEDVKNLAVRILTFSNTLAPVIDFTVNA